MKMAVRYWRYAEALEQESPARREQSRVRGKATSHCVNGRRRRAGAADQGEDTLAAAQTSMIGPIGPLWLVLIAAGIGGVLTWIISCRQT
jgi:hypothetical protein